MSGIGPVNLFSKNAYNPLSNATPVSGLSKEGSSSAIITRNVMPLGVCPYSIEAMFYWGNTNNNVIKGAFKSISTPKVQSAGPDGMLTGDSGQWQYRETYIEATYARLGIEKDIAKIIPSLADKLPPISAGATFRYRTQDEIDDYYSPSRTSTSLDLAGKVEWPKYNSLIVAVRDWGSRFQGEMGDSDPSPTGIYLEDDYAVYKDKDDYSSVKLNANANYDTHENRITDVNFSAKGALKYVDGFNLSAQLGACYDGQLHPIIGVGGAYDRYSFSAALRYSQELGAIMMFALTANIGKKSDKAAGQASADKENKGVK